MSAPVRELRARRRRIAVSLFAGLLVLPSVVLAVLYWNQLQREREHELSAVPGRAQDAARRLESAMVERLRFLLDAEEARPWYHYTNVYSPADAVGDAIVYQRSPLATEPLPDGVVARFSYDHFESPDAPIEVLTGRAWPEDDPSVVDELTLVFDEFRRRKNAEGIGKRIEQIVDPVTESVPLVTAAVWASHADESECLERCRHTMTARQVPVRTSSFYLELYIDEEGQPRAVAGRRALLAGGIGRVEPGQDCLRPLQRGLAVMQGLLIDVEWLFDDMPFAVAEQVLDDAFELRTWHVLAPVTDPCIVCAEVFPVSALGFATSTSEDALLGRVELAINTQTMIDRFDARETRFLSLVTMLGLALVSGLGLVIRSVHKELGQAERAENFVAAVTHELRTPLSAIRLHGEMLRDGWAEEPERRHEYYGRILRETNRLSMLVERVLDSARVSNQPPAPRALDLNESVRALRRRLADADGSTDDLRFELGEDVPQVLASDEALESILANLVENARKYAPPAEGGEPLLVRTRRDGARVLLEVGDRGEGVPPAERERIFEAFHRVGSEATRSAPGAGLGLHLVQLHAQALGGRAKVRAREGGGSLFQVVLNPA